MTEQLTRAGGGPDPFQIAVLVAAAATALVLTFPHLVAGLHALQQDDYSNPRFARWLGTSKTRLVHGRIALVYVGGSLFQIALPPPPPQAWGPGLASPVAFFVAVRSTRRAPYKKPLVYTGRA